MLKSKNRLKSSDDFDTLYRDGVRFRGNYGMLICSTDGSPTQPKFGFVVNKKLGNAVKRHYFQRRLRHVVKEFLDATGQDKLSGLKCSYVAYKSFNKYSELRNELFNQLEDAKRLCEKR